jgi:hypothetical protein
MISLLRKHQQQRHEVLDDIESICQKCQHTSEYSKDF